MLKFSGSKKQLILITVIIVAFIFGIYFLTGIVSNIRKANSYVPNAQYPAYPKIDLTNKSIDEIIQLQRGEYLVKAGDCIACHTSPSTKDQPFAGGLNMQTPFGAIYTPNITPDPDTGIGGWTDEQFITAFREGISPQGHYYYPAFPYIYFNKVTDTDAKAIHAYLNAIPAINIASKPAEMMFPFNWRFIQLGWRLLFFYPSRTGAYTPDTTKSDAWNQGYYLVEGPGHCAMCHTPSYYILNRDVSLGAPIRKYNLTGAVIEGYVAPNISKSNLGGIPDDQILKVFTQYKMIGNTPVEGPMHEAVHDSLKPLTKEDLLAIITYLKSVNSPIPKDDVKSSSTGEAVYNNYCAACHNAGIGGAPRIGDKGIWQTLDKSGIEKLYAIAISGGGNMPAMGTCITCSDYEIRDAVDYMVASSRKSNEFSQIKTHQTPEQIYQTNCASCHNKPGSGAPQLGDKQAWQPIENKGFIQAYDNIMKGKNGHPANAGCQHCTDKDILSALKYMLNKGSSTGNNYRLW